MQIRRLLSALLLSSSLVPTLAFAQPSEGDIGTARALTLEGYAALEKRDYPRALDCFARAEALYHAPTVTLGLARAQVGLGKLASAQELYNRLIREPLAPGASPAFAQAIVDGRKELAALEPRVPSLIIQVRGASAPTVLLDGAAVPSAGLGVKRPVNPGKHVVRAGAPQFITKESTVTVAEAATETLTVELVAGPPGPLSLGGEQPGTDSAQGSSLRKTLGFVGIGVGAAGLAVGGIMAGLAAGKRSDLVAQCPSGHCPPSLQSKLQADVDSFRTLRTVSTIGFIAGGAVAAAGVILVVTAPKSAPRSGANILPIVGPGYAGFVGRF